MAAFVLKVFTLTLRTAAKPLAQRFQQFVLTHPTLRPRVVKLAQAVHKMETRVTRHAEGKTGKVFVGELSDENALDLAGKIVAVAVVAFEYNRQSKKDGEKARKESAYRSEAESRYREQLEAQRRHEERLAALERRLEAVAGRWEQQLAEQEAEQAKQQLQRSNSFYNMFSLSRS